MERIASGGVFYNVTQNECLGDLAIGIESYATCSKIRRIMGKRVVQEFWSQSYTHKKQGNRPRYSDFIIS